MRAEDLELELERGRRAEQAYIERLIADGDMEVLTHGGRTLYRLTTQGEERERLGLLGRPDYGDE